MKKKLPSKTQINRILAQSQFDPRAKGHWAVVVSFDDPAYCEKKAIELINEAQVAWTNLQHEDYHARIQQAVQLLALARIQRGASTD